MFFQDFLRRRCRQKEGMSKHKVTCVFWLTFDIINDIINNDELDREEYERWRYRYSRSEAERNEAERRALKDNKSE